jgi:putative transposase
MARQPRMEYPGALYHVMARGDRREQIAHDENDRYSLIETLGEACGKTGWLVHAWVLIDNHYHAVIETPQGNLVVGMRWFQNTYTWQTRERRIDLRTKVYKARWSEAGIGGQNNSKKFCSVEPIVRR